MEQIEHEMHYPVMQVVFHDEGINLHVVRSPHYSEDILIPEENATPMCQAWLEVQVKKRKDIISTLKKLPGKEEKDNV